MMMQVWLILSQCYLLAIAQLSEIVQWKKMVMSQIYWVCAKPRQNMLQNHNRLQQKKQV